MKDLKNTIKKIKKMKAEETIKCRDLRDKWETKNVETNENIDNAAKKLEQYENQRVIDELERIKKECSKVGSRYITWCVLKEGIDKRIKELKQ